MDLSRQQRGVGDSPVEQLEGFEATKKRAVALDSERSLEHELRLAASRKKASEDKAVKPATVNRLT